MHFFNNREKAAFGVGIPIPVEFDISLRKSACHCQDRNPSVSAVKEESESLLELPKSPETDPNDEETSKTFNHCHTISLIKFFKIFKIFKIFIKKFIFMKRY
jgi:hypothetical protein